MKRLRRPLIKEGQLLVYWGRESPREPPDVMFAWRGDFTMKRDSRLLHYHLATQRPDWKERPLFSKMLPSLLEELTERGYDITTLRFSIMKKEQP